MTQQMLEYDLGTKILSPHRNTKEEQVNISKDKQTTFSQWLHGLI